MEDIAGFMAGALGKEYERCDQPGLKIMTNKVSMMGDDREVNVVKYYKVTKGEDYEMSNHPRHYGVTYMKKLYDVKPRKFYSVPQVEAFVKHIERLAGRKLDDAETMLMLRHITRGEHYELVCLVNITKEVKEEVMYKEY